jgi:hypothetical protein
MVEVPESVTICVTSCGRLDLLQKTLASFTQFNAGGKFILSEDSADPEIIKQVRNLFPQIVVLHDEARTGLMKSIDRIYSKVETDFIFHLEDDWEFDGPVDWLSAIALLNARPEVANINVRKFDEIKPKWRSKSDPLPFEGVDYQLMRLSSHPEFFAWSPNPGLIRTDLYRTYAPFSRFMPDQLSGIIKRDGGRPVMRGLCRCVHDRVGPDSLDEPQHALAVADVQFVVREGAEGFGQPLLIPTGVAGWAEKH